MDGPEDLGAALDTLQLLDLEGEQADLLLQLRLAQIHTLTQAAEDRHQVSDPAHRLDDKTPGTGCNETNGKGNMKS